MTQEPGWPGLSDEELLVAVANTGHGEHDELADPPAMRVWWAGLHAPTDLEAVRPHATEDLATLRALRAVVRGLALRNNGIDVRVDAAGLDRLTLRPDLRGSPSLLADGPDGLVRDVCAATVTALLRATARPGWPRLKACRGTDCRWVFIDSSRNTSRRWCDMAVCGNRAKSASFRTRRSASEPVA
ncbi:putative Zn-ribbon protein [Frankia torreyi]|uniref:Putative Zn-ribbon protein n=1 Tax=Frankia torreyi TaxID=1856 RepID=A0A0D8B8A3_9ACTN|nr:CGNR zinc finger domain-containing protein [Frankia torreyi]KJE20164.1 putative Zn-ribbon protein [Frankia torreyi]